ncbi:MAG: CusA/CzcA family heavy metal efflux RND transporter [Polyangiales bacterium]
MLKQLVELAVSRPWAVIAVAVVAALVGYTQMLGVPIEAFPDVTNLQVQVITLAPGRAAEETERQVTIPIERELAGLPDMVDLRSVSVFGLSQVTCTFEDRTDDFMARTRVAERLRQVDLPEGLTARLGPESTPVGEIYRYTVEAPSMTAMDRRGLQDYVVSRALRRVPGVADVVSFGGFQRQYQVRVNPTRLSVRGIGISDVVEALQRSSGAAGGNYMQHGAEEYVVRGLGYLQSPRELSHIALRASHGVPIHIDDVAEVVLGHVPRRGVVGRGDEDEAPEGIVLLRKRAPPGETLEGIHREVERLNREVLPRGARVVPYYDRTELMERSLHTVRHNLLEGALLVIAVLAVFLGALRGPLVVATVIPLALLTAFTGLRILKMPANLISLGAVDFGILVDGAVIFVETVYHVGASRPELTRPEVVREAAAQVVRPVVYSLAIITAALLPIFTMERVEGRIFAPMALTYGFALLGALVWSLTIVPALSRVAIRLPKATAHGGHAEPAWITALRARYERTIARTLSHPIIVVAALVAAVAVTVGAGRGLGSEFLPELNEGGMFVTAVFPASQSLEEGARIVPQLRRVIGSFPEVREVVSQLGRPEDGTDPASVTVAQIMVSLKPEETWTTGRSRAQLVEAMRAELHRVPGVDYIFSQPIVDNVLESISGIKGKVAIKIFGDDLDVMQRLAEQTRDAIAPVRGVRDLGLYQTGVAPQLRIDIDREAIARYGLRVADVDDVVSAAIGGTAATEIWEGERRIEVTVRVAEPFRVGVDRIREIPVRTPDGARVPLGALAEVHVGFGRAAIQRNQAQRFIALKFNIEGRDLGSVVAEARARVRAAVNTPAGYSMVWGGEFESQQRAMRRLAVIVPVAVLLICLLLYGAFGRARSALVVLAAAPLCLPGAALALRLAGVSLSVSAVVGGIALLGQTVLSGVVIVSSINELKNSGAPRSVSLIEGAARRMRAVLITAALAALGLLPAAMSHAMGSETQRPFALVIVGGVALATPLLLLVLPTLYRWIEQDELATPNAMPQTGEVDQEGDAD